MKRILTKSILILSVSLLPAIACADTVVYVSKVGSVYQVSYPDGRSVYVKDVDTYLKNLQKSKNVEGFGGKMTSKEFAKGTNPVQDTAEVIAKPIVGAANTAYNTANLVPSWRRYTTPVRAALGLSTKKSNRR